MSKHEHTVTGPSGDVVYSGSSMLRARQFAAEMSTNYDNEPVSLITGGKLIGKYVNGESGVTWVKA